MTKEDVILERIALLLNSVYMDGIANKPIDAEQLADDLLKGTNAYALDIVDEAVRFIKPAYCTETETMVDKSKVITTITQRLT